MSDIATIKVMYKPGKYEMIINESDFDEKIHEKIGEKKVSNKPAPVKKVADDELKALIGEE
jgi:hypothetical protein